MALPRLDGKFSQWRNRIAKIEVNSIRCPNTRVEECKIVVCIGQNQQSVSYIKHVNGNKSMSASKLALEKAFCLKDQAFTSTSTKETKKLV